MVTLSAHWGALYNKHPPKLTSLFSFSLNSFRIPNFSNNAAETKSHKALNSKCNNCNNYHMTWSVPTSLDLIGNTGTAPSKQVGKEKKNAPSSTKTKRHSQVTILKHSKLIEKIGYFFSKFLLIKFQDYEIHWWFLHNFLITLKDNKNIFGDYHIKELKKLFSYHIEG